ncbi:metal binding protein [Clostridium putrefaciens]|uniref:Metal binding protein n=1 Tax=Clostridium putrefaciens TaxID=99675 RepID=A0A381J9G1_9CLOT|nr:metal ABC transporter substrate-binding protein [Clostridium putrefaciens]SUY47874.1 metal binding protein [Clostridium putrefaciens]
MKKKLFKIIGPLCMMILLSACVNKKEAVDNNENAEKKIFVVSSFNAMTEFAMAIGGDKIEITTIVPSGVEAHDFEPKAKDMKNMSKADLFVYNGLEMEHWAEDILKSIDNKNLVVVEASKGADLIKTSKQEGHEHGHFDPHVWLSLKEAKVEANNIKEALVKIDYSNKSYYEENYKRFEKELDDLKDEYESKIKPLQNKTFVTGHAAFAYLCREFDLHQYSVEDVFAEGEPTPQKIKELVSIGKEVNLKTVFTEENVSPKVSETLAREIGAKTETINTLESEGNYIETMRENLQKIYESLN